MQQHERACECLRERDQEPQASAVQHTAHIAGYVSGDDQYCHFTPSRVQGGLQYGQATGCERVPDRSVHSATEQETASRPEIYQLIVDQKTPIDLTTNAAQYR